MVRSVGRYLWNVLYAVDLLGSALTGGSARETISSRIGRWKLRRLQEGAWPPSAAHPVYWIERGLDWIDPNHVLDAIRPDDSEQRVVAMFATRGRRFTA